MPSVSNFIRFVLAMWQQLLALLARTSRLVARGSVAFARELMRLSALAWSRLKPRLQQAARVALAFIKGPVRTAARLVFQVVAALLLLFYEWGWQPLAALLARLSTFRIVARLETWIKGLPPYPALALFATPAVCLIPVKLLALYLFATGHALLGIGLIVAAKVVGTAFVARIFILTQPQLMQIAWFKSAHDRFVPWKDAMFAAIRSSSVWRNGRIVRVAVKRGVNRAWIGLKPQRARIGRLLTALRGDVQAFFAGLGRDLH